jgi:hypothetical protein
VSSKVKIAHLQVVGEDSVEIAEQLVLASSRQWEVVIHSPELYGGIMSTPLVAVAVILAFFALILVPLMMVKSEKPTIHHQRDHVAAGKRSSKKKKKR